MDLKDFQQMPPDGLFDKIEARVRRRKMWRRMGVAGAAVAVVAAVGAVAVFSHEPSADGGSHAEYAVRQQVPTVAEVPQRGVEAVPTTEAASAPAQHVSVSEQPVAQSVAPSSPSEAKPVKEEPVAVSVTVEPVVSPAEPAAVAEAVEVVRQEASASVAEADDEVDMSPSEPKAEPASEPATTMADQMWAPNAIAPAGEVDEVRHFAVRFSSEISQFNIRIFNRRGLMVFHSDDPSFSWDATYGGSAVPQGAYVWVVSYRDSQGKVQQRQGTVTVVR